MNDFQTDPDPAAAGAIGEALDRLRSKRRGPAGRRGPADHGPHSPEHHDPDPATATPRRGGGESPAIIRTIEALAQATEPLGVSDIGEAVGVDQPRASRLVQQGVARGFFVREADPADARRTRIALTERGREFAHGIRTHQRESLDTALESFSDTERSDLALLLAKLADHWPTP